MDILFKNVTKYNEKNYKQFLEFHHKKYSFSYNTYTIIMTFLLAFCIILNIVEKNWLFILLFIGLLLVFLLFRIVIPTKRANKTQEHYKNATEETFTFSFYKMHFTINEESFYYFNLYRIFETKDYFYLYVNDEKAALINKNSFEIGTSEEFSKFIKKKCLFKFSKQK